MKHEKHMLERFGGRYITGSEQYDNSIFFDEKNKRYVDVNKMDYVTGINLNKTFRNVSIYLYPYSTDLIFTDSELKSLILI